MAIISSTPIGYKTADSDTGLADAFYNLAKMQQQEQDNVYKNRAQQLELFNQFSKAKEQNPNLNIEDFISAIDTPMSSYKKPEKSGPPSFFREIGEKFGILSPEEQKAPEEKKGLIGLFSTQEPSTRLSDKDITRRAALLGEAKLGRDITQEDVDAYGLTGKVTPESFKSVADLARQEADFKRQYKSAQIKNLEGKPEARELENIQKSETSLRKEYNQIRQKLKTDELNIAYEKIKAAAEKPSAAGDFSMIFNQLKILDPGSTVREGEFAAVGKAGGLPDRIQQMYDRVASGKLLSPEQRADFLQSAEKLRNAAQIIQDNVDQRYYTLAEQNKLNAENIFGDKKISDKFKKLREGKTDPKAKSRFIELIKNSKTKQSVNLGQPRAQINQKVPTVQ